jgi:hypothetical protein
MCAREPDLSGYSDQDGGAIADEVFGDGDQVPYLSCHFRVVTYDEADRVAILLADLQ